MHSHADLIWPDGTFESCYRKIIDCEQFVYNKQYVTVCCARAFNTVIKNSANIYHLTIMVVPFYKVGKKVSNMGELMGTNFLTIVDDLATAVRQPVLSLAYTVKVN